MILKSKISGNLDAETMVKDKKTITSQIEEKLRSDIITGVLKPSTRLKLKELSSTYKVGVIPLREALSRLTSTGFVASENQKGFTVESLSSEKIIDLIKVRTNLECFALSESIKLGSINWETRIISAHHILDRLQITINSNGTKILNPEWEEAHQNFHESLISGCNSPWLLKFSHILRDQGSRYHFLSIHNKPKSRDLVQEHKDLLDAVLSRNIELSCSLLTKHFNRTLVLLTQ